ncbi:MAG: outer membrane protein assembly factor BamA [Candidatus Omnitrophica bacterium]|nr:outer membrane protein assembly factor BamA [Candidatus Omnitrophota bacterium]
MKRRFKVFFIYTTALLLLSLLPQFMSPVYSEEPPKDPLTITEIAIEGNKSVSSNTILSKIKIRTGNKFSQKAVNEEIKRIYAMGFFTDVAAEVEDYKGGLKLIFSVTEKPIIDKVTFKGNSIYREGALKKQMSTKDGDVLNRRRLSEDTRKIRDFYKKNGYPLVKVDYELTIDPATNKTQVIIEVHEKQKYRIRRIDFEGNNAFKAKRLLKVMSTRTDTLFTSGFLNEETLRQDMERLQQFYKSNGYIDAAASNTVEYHEETKGITVTIKIVEGEKYFVGDIVIKGETIFPEKYIRKILFMKRGEVYNPVGLRTDIVGIQGVYFDKGYMACRVTADTVFKKDTNTINITFNITEGSVSYVNEVRITGNTSTKDEVIRREIRLYPGEKFDGEKLKRSKQRLYDLGYFDEVIFDTEPTKYPDKKDLVVRVKETKTGEFSFGGGYSSVDRLLGFVQVTQRNFDLLNFPSFTGGGQNLSIRAELGYVRQNYVVSFTEPWIFGHPYLFGFDVFNYDRKRKTALGYGYGEQRTGGDLRFGKEFTDFDRADLIYKLERVKISDVLDDASSALKDEEGVNDISSLALTLTRDTTDSKYNPLSGHIMSITGTLAGGVIAGDKDFYKVSGLVDQFFSYKQKLVLELKLRAGWEDEYDDSSSVPIYERFFAGGANTVRGYKERTIGPRDSKTGDPIGGESMLIGNAELTYPIFKNFKIAAFYDVGNVWETAEDLCSGDFKSGAGAGIRVKTPIGPIKVDAGYPLDRAHPDDKKKIRFHFTMARGF